MGNFTALVEIIITPIIVVITEAHVGAAMEVTITDLTVTDETIIEAITIINTNNITHMMMPHRWNNMVHHVHSVEVLIILLNTVLKENMISIISWQK